MDSRTLLHSDKIRLITVLALIRHSDCALPPLGQTQWCRCYIKNLEPFTSNNRTVSTDRWLFLARSNIY